jgi:hypothetical protein
MIGTRCWTSEQVSPSSCSGLSLIIFCSPVFVVANVLVLSSPPALTLAQVLSLNDVATLADSHRLLNRLLKLRRVMRLNVLLVELFSGRIVS